MNILSSLEIEKAKNIRQVESSNSRLQKKKEELDQLTALNSSLLRNVEEYGINIIKAEKELQEAEDIYRNAIPQLERQVRDLYLLLEELEINNK